MKYVETTPDCAYGSGDRTLNVTEVPSSCPTALQTGMLAQCTKWEWGLN